MTYIETKLKREIVIDSIITIHYFEYMRDFVFRGEFHDFWEFMYVDKGSVIVQGGEQQFTLHAGDIIFHEPNEFHAIRSVGSRLAHFHVGESNRRPPCDQGKMPWDEITGALKEINYQGAIVMEPFIKMGGEVGRDVKVWRDISKGASEAEMEKLLADAASMLRTKMQ